MPAINIQNLASLSKADYAKLCMRPEDDIEPFLKGAQPIIDAVALEGDEALLRFAKLYDKADLSKTGIAVSQNEIDAALNSLDKDLLKTLEYAAENIRTYHEWQLPQANSKMAEIRPGVMVGHRYLPIESAAIYAPGGKGSFPSVTLMSAIPAVVAGVKQIILLTPPLADGSTDKATLVAAHLAGVKQIYRVGGAAAVAAAAFGTKTIPKVLKLEGPGSPWLVAAKRLLSDKISCRLPAGPSDSLIFADGSLPARLAALDLMIETEHGPDSSGFVVCLDADYAKAVAAEIEILWQEMSQPWQGFSTTVLTGQYGGVVIAKDSQQAYDFINDYAPEHLQILTHNPEAHLPHIQNAAEILLGAYSPGTLANYLLGPNCVLPTGGWAKCHSPLGVHDFLKSNSIAKVTKAGYDEIAAHAHRFASYEGFSAHANAVSDLRTSRLGD